MKNIKYSAIKEVYLGFSVLTDIHNIIIYILYL